MSLAVLRGSARRLAVVLVLISLWSLPHVAQTDDVCAPVGGEEHDESKHVFTAGDHPVSHGEHCAVCHWMRSLNPACSPRSASLTDPSVGSTVVIAAQRRAAGGAEHQLPARAPPTL